MLAGFTYLFGFVLDSCSFGCLRVGVGVGYMCLLQVSFWILVCLGDLLAICLRGV